MVILEREKRRRVLHLVDRARQLRSLHWIDVLGQIPHRDALVVVVFEVLHHRLEGRRFQTHWRMLHVGHAVKAKADNPPVAGLLRLLDEVFNRNSVVNRERRNIKRIVHRRAIGTLMPAASEGISMRGELRTVVPVHRINRPAQRGHQRSTVSQHLIFHGHDRIVAGSMP